MIKHLTLKSFPYLCRNIDGRILVETTNENMTVFMEKLNEIIDEINKIKNKQSDSDPIIGGEL